MSNGMVESGTTSNNLRIEKWERKSLQQKWLSIKDGTQLGLVPHTDQHTTHRVESTEKSLSNFLVHKMFTYTSEAFAQSNESNKCWLSTVTHKSCATLYLTHTVFKPTTKCLYF
jgi:hypothetical protein